MRLPGDPAPAPLVRRTRLYAGPVARLGGPIRAPLTQHDLLLSVGGDPVHAVRGPTSSPCRKGWPLGIPAIATWSGTAFLLFSQGSACSGRSAAAARLGSAALGVKLAQPDAPGGRPHRRRQGDVYQPGALDGSARLIPVVYVIFNDASYRILKQRTLALKGFSAEDNRYVAMDLVNPTIDYGGPGEVARLPGELVEKTADVGPAMQRGLAWAAVLGGRAHRRLVQGADERELRPICAIVHQSMDSVRRGEGEGPTSGETAGYVDTST